jgi:hypothetical protein
MVSRREMQEAVTALVRAGIAQLDAGAGVPAPEVEDVFGRPLEAVDLGGALWDRHCPAIPAPWRYRGRMDAPEVEDLNAVWEILENVGAKHCHPRGIAIRFPQDDRGRVATVLLSRVARAGRRSRRDPSGCVADGIDRGLAFAGLRRT